jgi:hypothetical protein
MEETMSLMLDQMEKCTFLDKTTAPDGYGGVIHEWKEGATFKAAISFDSSITARVAEVQGVRGMYKITVPKNITVDYHEAFVCLEGKYAGRTFRSVSKDDLTTPEAASFQVRVFNAEEWSPL